MDVFLQPDVLKTWRFVNLTFCKPDVLQTWRFVNLTFQTFWNQTYWNLTYWNLTFCGWTTVFSSISNHHFLNYRIWGFRKLSIDNWLWNMIDLSASILENSNDCQALIFVNWPEPTIRPMKKGLVTVRPARLSCRSTCRVIVLKGRSHEIVLYCTSRQAVLLSIYQDLGSLKLCTQF